MFNQNDINVLCEILLVGKANAQTAFTIAIQIGYPTDGNQVKTRKLIKYAIENGCLIKPQPEILLVFGYQMIKMKLLLTLPH